MNLSKKTKFTSFVLLAILNIVFRLPVATHEGGTDSYFIHNLATIISTYGHAGWIVHPVSFTGLYPLSYASASPFVLSGLSQVTGISIELMILLFCILLGILSIFFSFLFAKEIKNDDLFAFIVAFVFSISPNFLRFSIWDATTRTLFIVFLPFFLWTLMRLRHSFSIKYVGLSLSLLVFLFVSHKLSLFLPIIIIAFIATVVISSVYQKGKYAKTMSKLSIIIFPVVFLVLFFVQFLDISFYQKLLPAYYSGALFYGEDTFTIVLNIGADYLGKIGVLLFFGLIGLISLSRMAFSSFGKLFVIISFLMLTPLLVVEDYTPAVILPFLCILVGFGLIHYYDLLNIRKRITVRIFLFSLLVICLLISTSFSLFMADNWNVYYRGMSDKTYVTASFLGSYAGNSTAVAPSGLLSTRIAAFSSKACLPYGGAHAQRTSPEQLAYGILNANEVVTRPLSLSEILKGRMLYKLTTYPLDSKNDWVGIMESSPNEWKNKDLSSKYNIHYVVEAVGYSGQYWYWRFYYSRLLVSLEASGNKIYENGREIIWQL